MSTEKKTEVTVSIRGALVVAALWTVILTFVICCFVFGPITLAVLIFTAIGLLLFAVLVQLSLNIYEYYR